MVVRHVANVIFSKMESRNLKFGVDRILSSDISSTNNSLQDDSSQIISCSGCLSFLHRANRQCSLAEIRALYKNQVFYDHPLKSLTRANDSELNDRESDTGNRSKPKRSWSRAVFSNLQRKGLEKRFQLQKYITKPDRRQLAATLGLTDAQVKVWFQNRRMKWRHAKESSGQKLNPKKKSETLDSDSEVCACHDPDAETESDVDVQTIPE